jgi:mannitol/fructose-specific phosphotransferase system IIA component (Ntr-type)
MPLRDLFVGTALLEGGRELPKSELIAPLLQLLAQQGHFSRWEVPGVLDTVLRRERLGSTGIGRGVALPHGRHPAVPRPLGVLAVCRPPVAFDSLDGEPVDILALILVPPSQPSQPERQFAELLRSLTNQELSRRLREVDSADELEELVAGDGRMTRREWQTCGDPAAMLYHLGDRLSPRKRQLFACACVRRVWHLVAQPVCQWAVEVAERYADGLASEEEREAADEATASDTDESEGSPYSDAELAATFAILAHLDFAGRDSIGQHPAVNAAHHAALAGGPAEASNQAVLLRDVAGDPFRRVKVAQGWRAWNRGLVVRMAEEVYQEQAFERLPILADALEEAGATEAELLDHLRGPGPHLRGCWALNLILGRS